jgi:hypothetical protein
MACDTVSHLKSRRVYLCHVWTWLKRCFHPWCRLWQDALHDGHWQRRGHHPADDKVSVPQVLGMACCGGCRGGAWGVGRSTRARTTQGARFLGCKAWDG